MQPDLPRRDGTAGRSDNVGDVLASIRRLIAQDGAGRQLAGPPARSPGAGSGRTERADGCGPGQDRGRDDRGPDEWNLDKFGGALRLDPASIVAPAPAIPATEGLGTGTAARLHLVRAMPAAWTGRQDFPVRTGWMPAPIADWPLPRPPAPSARDERAQVPPAWDASDAGAPAWAGATMQVTCAGQPATGDAADAPAPARTECTRIADIPDTSPSEVGPSEPCLSDAGLSETEIAEAEAALARMLAPRRATSDGPSPPRRPDPCEVGAAAAEPADRAGRAPHPSAPEASVPANLFSKAAGQRGPILQGMIREAVRHHLDGDLGETFSHNLRLLVRQEIEAFLARSGTTG